MGVLDRHLTTAVLVCAVISLLLLAGVAPAAAHLEEDPTSTEETAHPDGESRTEEPSSSEESPAQEPSDTDDEAGSEEPSADPTETPAPSAPAEEPEADADDGAAVEPEEETTESAVPQEEELAPFAVPAPEDREAVITVKVGGDRTGATSVGGLAGVTLRLHDGGSGGPGDPVNEKWATCVSDSDGDCSFTIPDTEAEITERRCTRWVILFCRNWENVVVQEEGKNHDSRFWVVAESAPSGWYLNDTLVTGTTTNRPNSPYQFRTGAQLRAGNTYDSGVHFMLDAGADASGGVWQNVRVNPELLQTCEAGLDVALVLDLSASVSGSLGDLKTASKDMTEALAGTGSSLSLYTFGTRAPMNSGASGSNYAALSIDEGNNLQTIKNRIDGYQTGTNHAGGTGGTNWDRGLYQVAESAAQHDLAVVVTDGMPTFYGSGPSGTGSSTQFVEVEQAIFSANALKSQGTRVLAVGVGDGVNGGAANLRAISGQTSYASAGSVHEADYFQTGWNSLAALLEEVALGATCQANIGITKETTAYGEKAPSNGGAGWEFKATASSGKITPDATQSTDDVGRVEYTLQFATPTPTPAVLTLEEVLSAEQTASGWSLDEVQCTLNGSPISAEDARAEITVTVGDNVDCTFLNVQELLPEISIEKQGWDTPSADGYKDAEEIPTGGQVINDTTITWTYTVTNTGETPLEGIEVTDDKLSDDAVECPKTSLKPGESMVCTAFGAVIADP